MLYLLKMNIMYAGCVYERQETTTIRARITINKKDVSKTFHILNGEEQARNVAANWLHEKSQTPGCINSGSIKLQKRTARFVVELIHNHKKYSKDFPIHGNREQSYTEAETYRMRLSDDMNLTKTSVVPEIKYFVVETDAQYIAGFFDGDGSCCASSTKLVLNFVQASNSGVPPVLNFIQDRYGKTSCQFKPEVHDRRAIYSLTYTAFDQRKWDLTRDLCKYTIVKNKEVKFMWVYLNNRLTNIHAWKTLHIKEESQRLQNERKTLKVDDIDLNMLTYPYVAGLVDSDGCIRVTENGSNITVHVTQPSCPAILFALQKKFGGSVYEYKYEKQFASWSCSSAMVHEFLSGIFSFTIVKKQQIELALKYIDTLPLRTASGFKRKSMDIETVEQRTSITREIKRLKKI